MQTEINTMENEGGVIPLPNTSCANCGKTVHTDEAVMDKNHAFCDAECKTAFHKIMERFHQLTSTPQTK